MDHKSLLGKLDPENEALFISNILLLRVKAIAWLCSVSWGRTCASSRLLKHYPRHHLPLPVHWAQPLWLQPLGSTQLCALLSQGLYVMGLAFKTKQQHHPSRW